MNRRILGAVVGSVLGAIVGATVGGLVGRGISLFGDETVEAVVPMIFCAILGYAVGGAAGCKGSLDRIRAKRTTLAAVAAGLILLSSVIAGAVLGSDTAAVFVVVLVAGLGLSGTAGALIAGPGTVAEAAAIANGPSTLPVTRQTITPEHADPASAEQELAQPGPAARPRRTRPLRAGDAQEEQ